MQSRNKVEELNKSIEVINYSNDIALKCKNKILIKLSEELRKEKQAKQKIKETNTNIQKISKN